MARAGLPTRPVPHAIEVVSGSDGNYEFDVTVRFSALGADYLTVIKCKHYKNRVEREKVQAL